MTAATRLLFIVGILFVPAPAPAQTEFECTAIYDSNGTRMYRGDSFVILEHEGVLVRIHVRPNGFASGGHLYFLEPNCTGDTYMYETKNRFWSNSHIIGRDVWYVDTAEISNVLQPISSFHSSSTGNCEIIFGPDNGLVPTLQFTLPPFVPPFHLEPEPCCSQASEDLLACTRSTASQWSITCTQSRTLSPSP